VRFEPVSNGLCSLPFYFFEVKGVTIANTRIRDPMSFEVSVKCTLGLNKRERDYV
jgi:hypothetical protein